MGMEKSYLPCPYFWIMENVIKALAKTPLCDVHVAAGASLVPFAGF